MDYKVLDDYFNVNFYILKMSGVWMPDKSEALPKRLRSYAYNFVLFLYCFGMFEPVEIAVLFSNPGLTVMIRSFRDQFNHFLCIYKLMLWYNNRKEILEIMRLLRSKEFIYEEIGEFSPRKIIEKQKKKADMWVKTLLHSVNCICLCMCASVFFLLIFQYEKHYIKDEKSGELVYNQQLPVNIFTPFPKNTRLSFALHFVFEIFPLAIYGWIIVGLDTLFTGMMSCVSANFYILQGAFETIRPRCLRRLNLPPQEVLRETRIVQVEMMKEMNKCIRHLQTLIRVSERLEEVYNLQNCGQVLVSLFEMCFCLYLLSYAFNESFGIELMYLVSTSFELFFFCWFGNELTEASAAIPEALFKSDWLSADEKFKKNMIITMTRMSRPVQLTIGKFSPLAFTSFLAIARIAYSFFTALRTGVIE